MQVSHHPPISAMHAESTNGWVLRQEYQGDVKFRGVMKVRGKCRPVMASGRCM